jgi:predicted phosphodiesterase
MKIHLLSDLHLEFAEFDYVLPDGADILILAGDIGVERKTEDGYIPMGIEFASSLPIKTIYIAGNHEFYTDDKKRTMSVIRNELQFHSDKYDNVLYAENQVYIEQDVMFVCCTLWTDFGEADFFLMNDAKYAMNDYRYIYKNGAHGPEKISPQYIYMLHKESLTFVEEMGKLPFKGKKILVCHHAPSYKSVPNRYEGHRMNAAYCSNLENTLQNYDFCFHGHMHNSVDYQIGNCRVVANPRGYCKEKGSTSKENKLFDPLLLIDTDVTTF